MDANITRIREIFADVYGAENVTARVAGWRLFFLSCSGELFPTKNAVSQT